MADEPVGRTLFTLRVILLAVITGIVALGIVAVVLVAGGTFTTRPHLATPLLPVLGLTTAALIVVYPVVRQALIAGLRRAGAGEMATEVRGAALVGRFKALTIIGGALAEAPSLFGIVVFLLTGQWLALLVPALGLGAVVLLIPSRDRFARFSAEVTGGQEQ
jgi:hypothetical protein